MKRFLIQVAVFLGCVSLFILIILYTADGHADGLYLKFTTPKQKSLVLGTSKAAQGIQPTVLNEELDRKDIFNYSFSVIHSPYGPAYLESIKKKLKDSVQNGIFILTVDPHSISSRSQNPNDSLQFREKGLAIDEIENVATNPNFDYLLYHYPEQYIYLLTRKIKYVSQGLVHDNGWIETNLPMDARSVEKRTEDKIITYSAQVKTYSFSDVRLKYLEKTIEYLKERGMVYLVRLPVVKPILKLENSIVPNFDELMEEITKKYDLDYLDLTSRAEKYTYDDGNHLDERSGKVVTKEIADWIKSVENNKN